MGQSVGQGVGQFGTAGSRPRLSLLRGGRSPDAAFDEGDGEDLLLVLAGEIAVLLAAAPADDATAAPLALPLALSACMARYCVDPEGLIEAMLPLRRALIAVSALDPAREPVPLAAGEPEEAVLHLARYLHGLLARASAATDLHPDALASAAAAQLRSA